MNEEEASTSYEHILTELRRRNDELEESQSFLRGINRFSSDLLKTDSIDDIPWIITKNVIGGFNFEDCVVYFLDEEKGGMQKVASHYAMELTDQVVQYPLFVPIGKGVVGRVAESGKPEIVSDTRGEPEYIVDNVARLSEITVPLIVDGKVIGIIDSEHSGANYYTQNHLETLIALANLAAAKIRNLQMLQQAKSSRKALQTRENHMKTVLNNAMDAVVNYTYDGLITFWNHQAESMFGWSFEEVSGKKLFDLIMTPDLDQNDRVVMKSDINLGNQPVVNRRMEVPVLRKDGSSFPAELTITTVREDDGMSYSAFVRDITESRRYEQKLEKSEARFRNLVETADDLIYETNTRGICTYANPVIAKLLGVPSEDLIGTNLGRIIRVDYAKMVIDTCRMQLRHRIPATYHEFPIVTTEGKQVWIGQNVRIVEENGVVKGFMAVSRVITDKVEAQKMLKRSEERYRNIMESIELGMIEVDPKGQITRAYDHFCKMTGYTSDELVGQHARTLLLPKEFYDLMDEENRKRKEGKSGIYEIQIIQKGGKRIWVLVSETATYDEFNRLVGSISIHYDITERKRDEQLLKQQHARLERVNIELDRFFYSVTHDLKAPLANLQGLVSISKLETDKKKLPEYYDLMDKSIRNMRGFVSDLITYSRNANVEVEHETFNIELMLSEIIREHQFMKNSDQIDFTIKVKGLKEIKTDVSRFRIVFNNLISNAIKYHDFSKEKPFVKVRASTSGGVTRISVEDNGVGIDGADIVRIFDMFYHVESSGSNVSSSGIGLYILKETLKKIDGDISVSSEKGEGTTFTVILPNGS